MPDPWAAQRDALGAYIRNQRKLANLSLRQLAELTSTVPQARPRPPILVPDCLFRTWRPPSAPISGWAMIRRPP